MINDRFSIRVQAVLRVFDSFTYKPVEKNHIIFSCDGNAKILPKEEGFFVVIGSEKPKNITVKSVFYKDMSIDLYSKEDSAILNLWAEPKKGYSLAGNINWIKTSAMPFEKVYAFECDCETHIRLLENAKENDMSLKIYQERKFNLDGADMLLYSKENAEMFEIINIKCLENGICELNKPIKESHKKIKTGLYKLMSATADEFGNCEIAVLKRSEKAQYIILNSQCEKIDEVIMQF